MTIDYEKYPKPERVRHHMSANVYFPFDDRNPRPGYYPPVIKKVDWEQFFSNGNSPDFIDIGCGMGRFMLDYAANHPSRNILGLEIRREPVNWINSVINGENLKNAGVLRYSLANGLPFIKNKSITGIFYFFPDPWYKKRHHKRRVFSHQFLDECIRLLRSDGKLYIQTDVAELHNFHKEVLSSWRSLNPDILLRTNELFKSSDGQWELPETDQEQIAIRADFEVHRLIVGIE